MVRFISMVNKQRYGLMLFLFIMGRVEAAPLSIHLSGVQGEVQKNILHRLQGLQQTYPSSFDAAKAQQFNQAALPQIQLALQPFGYFAAGIQSKLAYQSDKWQASYIIHLGPPIRLRYIIIQLQGPGRFDANLNQALNNFPLQSGQPLNIPLYQNAKQQLFTTALSQGYLNAAFSQQQIKISLQQRISDIALTLNTGPRFYFGPVSFNTVPLSKTLLQRYVPFWQGMPFSSKKLSELQQRLHNSPYVATAQVTPQLQNKTYQQIPIAVKLTLLKKQQISSGIGYGTDTGPRLNIGSRWRYINQAGHSINTQLLLSSVQNVLLADYRIPGKNPAIDQYSFTASLINTRLNQGNSRTEQLSASAIKQITPQWQRTLSLSYQIEQFKFNQQIEQHSYLLIPGMRWIYLNSNSSTFPTQGNRFLISAQGSLGGGISEGRFGQIEIQNKYITHFGDKNRVIMRGDIGYSAIHDLANFPFSLRFYTGGSQSVRGFTYQGLGPGKYLVTGSIEWQQQLFHKWYGAIFYDTGNAMDRWHGPLPYSTGVGIVWASPLGTMELTLAKAWNLPDQPLRLQFVIGPDW